MISKLRISVNLKLVFSIAVVLLSIFGCSQNKNEANTVDTVEAIRKDISAAEAYDMVYADQRPEDLVLLDVRRPQEYQHSHLEESVLINIADPSFSDKIDDLERDKTYVVYCRSGRRSSRASGIMEELGFKKIYNVQGGILAWQAANYPIVK